MSTPVPAPAPAPSVSDQRLAEWGEVCADMGALHAAVDFLTIRAMNVRALGYSVDYYDHGAKALRALPALLAEVMRLRAEREKMLPVCEAMARHYIAEYHGDENGQADAWSDARSLAIGVVEFAPNHADR